MNVFVVIPAFNCERFLSATVQSVAAQTHAAWKLVIVDDGSTDSTRQIAAKWCEQDPRITYTRRENGGVANARNLGLSFMPEDTDAVILLDHDDVLLDDALESLTTRLAEQPQAVAAYGLGSFIDVTGASIRQGELEATGLRRYQFCEGRVSEVARTEPAEFSCIAFMNHIATPGQVLIRRQALAQVGPFCPEIAPCDDWDMWVRLARLGPFAFLGRPVIGWRQHDANESRDVGRLNRAWAQVYERFARSSDLSDEQRQVVREGYRFWRRTEYHSRMLWARAAWRQRMTGAAAKQVYHAVLVMNKVREGLNHPSRERS